MLTKKLWLLLSIVAAFFLFLGILLEVWIKHWGFIKLKPEVDVFAGITALVTVGVTLLVAYWVTSVLEKRNTDSRTEKGIIIKHIDLLYLILEELRSKVRDGQINYSLAASNIKRLSVNTAAVDAALIIASLDLDDDHETLIMAELSILKDLLTNTIPGNQDLVVNNNIITISSNRQILIDFQLDKARNEIFKLELSINRA